MRLASGAEKLSTCLFFEKSGQPERRGRGVGALPGRVARSPITVVGSICGWSETHARCGEQGSGVFFLREESFLRQVTRGVLPTGVQVCTFVDELLFVLLT